MRILKLDNETKKNILNDLLKRSPSQYAEYEETVKKIVNDVALRGDEAVCEYTSKFDGWDATPDKLKVPSKEIDDAYKAVDEKFVNILREAAANIVDYHVKQKKQTWISTKDNGSI